MKKLYIGIITGAIVFIVFLSYQNNFAQHWENSALKKILSNKAEFVKDSLKTNSIIHGGDEKLRILEQKVEDMEKYVNEAQKYIDASQKNLDLWLKYLAFTLSVLIGYSIFTGIRTHERAKDELEKLKTNGEEIKRLSDEAKIKLKKLKKVTDLISQVETDASNTKKLVGDVTEKLNEFTVKENIVLTEAQVKTIDETINNTKEELQKSGIEAFKNLYFAKALKATSEEQWEDVIRLLTTYIDLDDSNAEVFHRRAYAQLAFNQNNEKALADYMEAIRLHPGNYVALHNRAVVYKRLHEYDKALIDYNEAIRLNPNYILAYTNRSELYSAMGKNEEAAKDLEIANRLKLDKI